ncbi:unnamed protein product [Malus baccata var. baccata]
MVGGLSSFRLFLKVVVMALMMDCKECGEQVVQTPDEYICIKFEFEISEASSYPGGLVALTHDDSRRHDNDEIKRGLSFSICMKIVQASLEIDFVYPLGNTLEQPNSNSQFSGLWVIVADDDNVNRTVTSKLLEKLGCQVTAVSSGFECLSALTAAENSFQIVVLDLHMPEMDGFEVAMRIRKFCSRSWPSIIALTASAEEHIWERCLQLGMNGLIRKPVLLQGMADELCRVLQ